MSLVFGVVMMFSGLIGVPAGMFLSTSFKRRNPRADPLICAFGLLTSTPLMFLAAVVAGYNEVGCYVLIFFASLCLNLNWSIVADMLLVYFRFYQWIYHIGLLNMRLILVRCDSNSAINCGSISDFALAYVGRCRKSISYWISKFGCLKNWRQNSTLGLLLTGFRILKSRFDSKLTIAFRWLTEQYISPFDGKQLFHRPYNWIQELTICAVYYDICGSVGWVVLPYDSMVYNFRQGESRQRDLWWVERFFCLGLNSFVLILS